MHNQAVGDDIVTWVRLAVEAADDKLGQNTAAFFVGEIMAITDWFVITSGRNNRQVRAIVDAVEEALTEVGGPKPVRIEGRDTMSWVLMDYGLLCGARFHRGGEGVLRSRTSLEGRAPPRPEERLTASLGVGDDQPAPAGCTRRPSASAGACLASSGPNALVQQANSSRMPSGSRK